MPIRLAKPRKRGQRAGLTTDRILNFAIHLLGRGRFSLRGLAKGLLVEPRAIQGRFDGGLATFWPSLAQFALVNIARPLAPSDNAASYIRDLFRAMLKTFRNNPALAGIVAREMAGNYALVPRLTERVLVALRAGGLSESERIAALDIVFGAMAGLLLIETGTTTTQKAHADALIEQLSGLSPTEFPELTNCAKSLADRIAKRPHYDETVADRYADLVILRLKLTSAQKRNKPRQKGATGSRK
jgi:hypothetical protein